MGVPSGSRPSLRVAILSERGRATPEIEQVAAVLRDEGVTVLELGVNAGLRRAALRARPRLLVAGGPDSARRLSPIATLLGCPLVLYPCLDGPSGGNAVWEGVTPTRAVVGSPAAKRRALALMPRLSGDRVHVLPPAPAGGDAAALQEHADLLLEAMEELTGLLGRCDGLAYPNGGEDERVRKAAEAAGYRYAVTAAMPRGGRPDRYGLGRRVVSELSAAGLSQPFDRSVFLARVSGFLG